MDVTFTNPEAKSYSDDVLLEFRVENPSGKPNSQPLLHQSEDSSGNEEEIVLHHNDFSEDANDEIDIQSENEKPEQSKSKKSNIGVPQAGVIWSSDDSTTRCEQCYRNFTFFLRKHHCRACGHIFCDACSPFKVEFPESFRKVSKYKKPTQRFYPLNENL
jgi:ribosomal protein L37E